MALLPCHVDVRAPLIGHALSAFVVEKCVIVESDGCFRIDSVDMQQEDGTEVVATLGVGRFVFEHDSYRFQITIKVVGNPVTARSCNRDTAVHESFEVCGPDLKRIRALCAQAVEWRDHDVENCYQVMTWRPGDYWSRVKYARARSFDTIVLEAKMLEELKADLARFLAKQTADWYQKHSIPYRRGYLLHGPPGTGKTSLLAAMATQLGRRLYRINMSAPTMTDDSLSAAMSNADGGILTLEDVDALFDNHRENVRQGSTVTFSGLLNAIDGVTSASSSKGLIMVMTTNYPDRLDPALCREGRVDRTFVLGRASTDMTKRMFLRFYPDAKEGEADRFATSVFEHTNGSTPTPAELQSHFIKHVFSPSEDAVRFEPSQKLSREEQADRMWA